MESELLGFHHAGGEGSDQASCRPIEFPSGRGHRRAIRES